MDLAWNFANATLVTWSLKTYKTQLWLDLQKPSRYAQELKFILLLIVIVALAHYPDTITKLA